MSSPDARTHGAEIAPHEKSRPFMAATSAAADDADRDGLPDALEDALAASWAPIVRLAPRNEDWTRPANVDWYLQRVHMRLDRRWWQRDIAVLPVGAVTQRNMATQCVRGPHGRTCSNADVHFFLEPHDDDVQAGAPPSDWVSYVHVRHSTVVPGGVDIQYWLFWPYNDGFATVNHEGDWEQLTETLTATDRNARLQSVWCSQHRGGRRYAVADLELRAGRPVVYAAEGSHALYASPGVFPIPGTPFGISDHADAGGPEWDTRRRLVNVGERGHSRNGQTFIEFAGRWGRIGEFDVTCGPRGPGFHDSWVR